MTTRPAYRDENDPKGLETIEGLKLLQIVIGTGDEELLLEAAKTMPRFSQSRIAARTDNKDVLDYLESQGGYMRIYAASNPATRIETLHKIAAGRGRAAACAALREEMTDEETYNYLQNSRAYIKGEMSYLRLGGAVLWSENLKKRPKTLEFLLNYAHPTTVAYIVGGRNPNERARGVALDASRVWSQWPDEEVCEIARPILERRLRGWNPGDAEDAQKHYRRYGQRITPLMWLVLACVAAGVEPGTVRNAQYAGKSVALQWFADPFSREIKERIQDGVGKEKNPTPAEYEGILLGFLKQEYLRTGKTPERLVENEEDKAVLRINRNLPLGDRLELIMKAKRTGKYQDAHWNIPVGIHELGFLAGQVQTGEEERLFSSVIIEYFPELIAQSKAHKVGTMREIIEKVPDIAVAGATDANATTRSLMLEQDYCPIEAAVLAPLKDMLDFYKDTKAVGRWLVENRHGVTLEEIIQLSKNTPLSLKELCIAGEGIKHAAASKKPVAGAGYGI